MSSVYVCAEKDIACGDRPENWCKHCPARNATLSKYKPAMTDDNMPEPVAWRYVPSDVWADFVLTDDAGKVKIANDYGRNVEPLYTESQLRAALAAQAEKHAAEVPRWWTCKTHGDAMPRNAWGCPDCVRELRTERDALRAEVEALRAAMGQIITMAERGIGLDPSSMDNYFVWIQDKARAAIDAARSGGGK